MESFYNHRTTHLVTMRETIFRVGWLIRTSTHLILTSKLLSDGIFQCQFMRIQSSYGLRRVFSGWRSTDLPVFVRAEIMVYPLLEVVIQGLGVF